MSATLRDHRLEYDHAILQSRSCCEALLGCNSSLDGLRVLVLGAFAADTLCALLHTECRSAEARQPDAYIEGRCAHLVLVPHVTLTTISRVICQAARALHRSGRIVIAVPLQERDFVNLTTCALVRAGFDAPLLAREGGQTRIVADYGRSGG